MSGSNQSFDDIFRAIFESGSDELGGQMSPDVLEEGGFELSDSEDVAILMHRDAHFGGSFDTMIEYYEDGGRGIQELFSTNRMRELQQIENYTGQDLSEQMFGEFEQVTVDRVKELYQMWRKVYDLPDVDESVAKGVADLVLTEEEDPEDEIAALVVHGRAAVPYLLRIVTAQEYYDPLFPGYGMAPQLAAEALGRIADPEAIVPLFEALNSYEFFTEATIIQALTQIGQPAKEFLLRALAARPLTADNERAASALTHFASDPAVAAECLKQLQDLEVRRHPRLLEYLVLGCEGLEGKEQQQQFLALMDQADFAVLRQDISAIARQFPK